MRKPIGVFFLALYFLALLRPLTPWIEYYANKGYIQQFLCINQNKPKMTCAGKCHLQKRIEEANDTKEENLPTRINLEDYPLSLLTDERWQMAQATSPPSALNGIYSNKYKFLMSKALFHPPQV